MLVSNDRCIARSLEAETDTSEERELWAVSVPAVPYIREAFFGVIRLLGDPDSWNPISDVAAEYGSEILESLTQIVPPEVITVPANSEITLFPGNMTVSDGNPITNAVNTSARGNFVSQQSPNADQNARVTYRYMAAGAWEYRLTAVTASNGCSLAFRITDFDGTVIAVGTLNLRTAGTVFNTVFSGTFDLPVSGLTQIEFIVSAGTTGGFADLLQLLEMWRTDDL
jgi:hypothetical protein